MPRTVCSSFRPNASSIFMRMEPDPLRSRCVNATYSPCTSVANTSVAVAPTLERWAELFANNAQLPWVDPVKALGFDSVELDEGQVADVSNGRKLALACESGMVCCVCKGKLLALYERCGSVYKPATVIPGGVCGVN